MSIFGSFYSNLSSIELDVAIYPLFIDLSKVSSFNAMSGNESLRPISFA
jgi:hypothetical protein